MSPAVSYTPCTTSSRGNTGNIITFAQSEEGNLIFETQNLLSEIRDDTESGNESNYDLTMPLLINEEEMDMMS